MFRNFSGVSEISKKKDECVLKGFAKYMMGFKKSLDRAVGLVSAIHFF